jgi:hypothetical protein
MKSLSKLQIGSLARLREMPHRARYGKYGGRDQTAFPGGTKPSSDCILVVDYYDISGMTSPARCFVGGGGRSADKERG